MTEILPNSLAKQTKGVVRRNGQNWIPIFCANCGADGGLIPEDAPPFAFWLCNDCVMTHGVPAAMMCKPDEVFWEEIRQEQLEKEKKQCLSIKLP